MAEGLAAALRGDDSLEAEAALQNIGTLIQFGIGWLEAIKERG